MLNLFLTLTPPSPLLGPPCLLCLSFLTQVWIEAALQIFYSLGVGFGGLLTFASYNTFHQNIYRSVPAAPQCQGPNSDGRLPGRLSWVEVAAGQLTMAWVGILPCRDTFIVTLGNAITSILAGFAIFSVLGYMSQELGVPVDQVAKAGRWEQHLGVWLGER